MWKKPIDINLWCRYCVKWDLSYTQTKIFIFDLQKYNQVESSIGLYTNSASKLCGVPCLSVCAGVASECRKTRNNDNINNNININNNNHNNRQRCNGHWSLTPAPVEMHLLSVIRIWHLLTIVADGECDERLWRGLRLVRSLPSSHLLLETGTTHFTNLYSIVTLGQ